jgi:hypothetical protein
VEVASARPRRRIQEVERGEARRRETWLQRGDGRQPTGLPLGRRALSVGEGNLAEQSALLH